MPKPKPKSALKAEWRTAITPIEWQPVYGKPSSRAYHDTPPEAVHALLRAEKLPHCLWEPACGRGAIAHVLRDAGHRVIATDLVDYHSPWYVWNRAHSGPATINRISWQPIPVGAP